MTSVKGIFCSETMATLKAKCNKTKAYVRAWRIYLSNGKYQEKYLRERDHNQGQWFGEVLNEQQNVEMICKNIVGAVRKGKTSYLKGLNQTLNKDLALKAYGIL